MTDVEDAPAYDPGPSGAKELADSRIRFLAAEPVEPGRVRGPILASWRRSRDEDVAADKIELPYHGEPDVDDPLSRSAHPVLRSLREQLEGQRLSIILTDPTGLVLTRLTADGDLERHLDGVLLAPGFRYAEGSVGTNGIGTALEVGGATHVFGHEHYAENLEDLACAGVPIQHPISGRTVGAIDLTCWREDAGSLLLTLAKSVGEQIRQALLADAGAGQLGLYREYLRTCRRMAGVVFALDQDVVMLNDYARTVLDPGDQSALIARAAESETSGQRRSVQLELPSGGTARLHCHPVGEAGRPAGVVVHAQLGQRRTEQRAGSGAPMPLPGLVGSAPAWLRACREVETAFRSGRWLVVEGEPGVGKLAILRAVQLRRQPVGRFAVVDGADAAGDPHWLMGLRRALLEGADNVVVRHVDTLDPPQLRGLVSALRDVGAAGRDRPLWVAVTRGPDQEPPAAGRAAGHAAGSADLARSLGLFPSTVKVPPLRLHAESLQQLVPFFLARLGHGGRLVCSPEAMQLLMRSAWPGNVEQVHQLLRQVVRHRRTGSIRPEDLPPEARTVSRRLLSPLESMERDAIVQSLSDARGSKLDAARSLGMSRATIYRKIREYGVVSPTK